MFVGAGRVRGVITGGAEAAKERLDSNDALVISLTTAAVCSIHEQHTDLCAAVTLIMQVQGLSSLSCWIPVQ